MAEPFAQRDERDGYMYDARIKRGDTTFWSESVGAVAVDTSDSTTVLRVNADRHHSFLQHRYGNYEFALNVPANPGTGVLHTWGLRNFMDTSMSSAYFQVDSDVWRVVSYDDFGNQQATTLTWDTDHSGAIARYGIRWEQDSIRFLINDSVVATHTDRVGTKTQALELQNETASNLDLSYVRVWEAASIV